MQRYALLPAIESVLDDTLVSVNRGDTQDGGGGCGGGCDNCFDDIELMEDVEPDRVVGGGVTLLDVRDAVLAVQAIVVLLPF